MTLNKMALVAIAFSAISVTAYGADQKSDKAGKSGATSFQKVDADGNGAISMDEARSVPGLSGEFAKADKNGDGQLSKSEYEAAVKGMGKSSKKSSSKSAEKTGEK